MTRKHFELIARILAHAANYDETQHDIREEIAKDFAAELAEVNPRFDVARFLEACRV